jgi:hypothetical protein
MAADLPISNREMEVIITLMISIASEKNSVQSNQSTCDQVHQAQEAKIIHIANEATNGEQSESRQSGAGSPNEEASRTELGRSQTSPRESANKYKYTIFAGWEGERYLNTILKQILPYALWRTWSAAVSHQAAGKPCYVGAAAIARQEKVGERKVEIDLQELEARVLMERYRQKHQWPQADGTIKYGTVTVKDFSGLYDLAYEYHLWMHSPEYVEAEWDNAEDIKQDARLTLRLLRFDNYRHILTCQKPGPKGKRTPLQEVYHCQQPQEEQDLGAQQASREEPKANLYLDPSENRATPYRESNSKESYVSKENSISKKNLEERVFADVAHKAIRNEQETDRTEGETKKQLGSEIKEEQLKPKEVRRRDTIELGGEKSKIVETQQKEEMSRETAKDAEEYTVEELKQNPMTMIAFLLQLNEQERTKQEQQQAKNKKRHHKDQPKRKRLSTPEYLARTITKIVQDFGGNPQYLQSDITRITKLYWACTQIFTGFTNPWFLEQLTKASVKTRKARKVGKRVPYFFKTLEDILELTSEELAYIRSQEALYHDGHLKTFILGLQGLYETSRSELPYQEWIKLTYL